MLRQICFLLLVSLAQAGMKRYLEQFDERPTCPCGQSGQKSKRIIGGRDAGAGHYPYATSLLQHWNFKQKKDFQQNENVVSFCGATLITDSHVVTAAHCLYNVSGDHVAVDVADYDIYSPWDGKVREVKKMTIYPMYLGDHYFSDIAILEFTPAIIWEPGLRVAPLPPEDMPVVEHDILEAWGWGRLRWQPDERNQSVMPHLLQELKLSVLSPANCQKHYSQTYEPHMLCAWSPRGGICHGDSGSGAMLRVGNQEVLVGVVSFGGHKCHASMSTVFTRVSAFVKWIYTVTKSSGCKPCFVS